MGAIAQRDKFRPPRDTPLVSVYRFSCDDIGFQFRNSSSSDHRFSVFWVFFPPIHPFYLEILRWCGREAYFAFMLSPAYFTLIEERNSSHSQNKLCCCFVVGGWELCGYSILFYATMYAVPYNWVIRDTDRRNLNQELSITYSSVNEYDVITRSRRRK